MTDFRIIAIRTGFMDKTPKNYKITSTKRVEIDYLKNLKPNTVYSFYNHYTFPNEDFSEVIYHPQKDLPIYTIKLSDGKEKSVNINAIVGENGSGKSTLIELIYWINYNLGCKFKLLKDDENNEYLIDENLDVEILYSIGNKNYSILKFKDEKILQYKFELVNNKIFLNSTKKGKEIIRIQDLSDFFYSVVINYSQYSLNALEIGEWVNPLFHKNDGYQTPIVLNPMRIDGNIDINKERRLLSRRLQANVLEKTDGDINKSLRNLASNKIAKEFRVEYISSYFEELKKRFGKIKTQIHKEIVESIKEVFNLKIEEKDEAFKIFVSNSFYYIYYKLLKIVFNYPIYIAFRNGKSLISIKELIIQIKSSNSHITFKIKGAILHLKYYDEIYNAKDLKSFDYPFTIDINSFSHLIENTIKVKETDFFVNTYMMAFPSFFNVDIIPENELSMASFSSGEKQRIFSLSSIAYHLINLNSVEEQKIKRGEIFTSYKFINLVLDEIEMYYHPEWQRSYIYDLLGYISKISPENLKNIEGINITFITHSPFILSDIPTSNILKLINGEQKNEGFEKTFGSNIYDLLANDFFMNNGFIGKYAMHKIKEILDYISNNTYDEKIHNYYLNISDLIGDEAIRAKLSQLLSNILFESNDKKLQYIEELEKRKGEIDLQIKKLKND